MRARIIRVDGSTAPVDIPEAPRNRRFFMLKMLDCAEPELVSLVENGPGRPGLTLWMDVDALFSKPENRTATLLAGTIYGRQLSEYIAGDVLVTGGIDSEGDALGLTEIQDSVLAEFIPSVAAGVMAGV